MEPAAHQELKTHLAALLADAAGSAAETEADAILEAALIARPEAPQDLALELAGKRAAGAPLGLVLGRQRFLGVELLAKADVLAPREETEILGTEVLSILRALSQEEPGRELRMIDMGCGSGNLACAAAMAVPQVRIWASDITASCAELTRANAAHLGLQHRIEVSQGDLFAPLTGKGLEGTMDLVVMNPPYIPSTSLANSHAALLQHEPREAFDGGPYGISILSRLLQDAPLFLKPGAHLLFEFGLGQARMIQSLVEKKNLYTGLRFASDVEGHPRAAIARR
ncbi:class I SAM-dependent methyltransferase [Geothrix sp. PMB-07]|uniref:N5-glutamine methyltransferase family protein n=1 Tax=Geothrix sp. PMB-07 TaxID=3068640 RepID=UPI002741EF2F|nr:class I SAM-dependent methyltransferase [Geothrix sp. PMB-07]WLT29999.1 class I SAM-dependent methyltransferase [Geothrix sp. PMB-07]